MTTVALARIAMATRFELVLHGDRETALRAAGEEALDEIERLDTQLSCYRAASEISHINALAAAAPVRVEPKLFRLLQHAQRLHRETGGAFDITIAPLMRCWGFVRGTGRPADPAELAAARACVGMDLVRLNEAEFTVQFARAGMMLDLGAIGKGYALERAAEILREAGITRAVLHGGTSTVCAIGAPPDQDAWYIAIIHPRAAGEPSMAQTVQSTNESGRREDWLAVVPLKDGALSVSAVWGKSFEADGKTYGHVIDPRTGAPAQGAVLAAVALPSATESDALSTALLTLGPDGLEQIAPLRPGMRTLAVRRGATPDEFHVAAKGITASSE